MKFDNALLRNAGVDKKSILRDFFDVQNDDDLRKVYMGYRDQGHLIKKSENKDLTKIFFKKSGTNEYRAAKYSKDDPRILPLGVVKTAAELLEHFKLTREQEIPKFYEDFWGNIWTLEEVKPS